MKKTSAVLVMLLCVVFLLSACGGGETSPIVGKWTDETTGMTTMEFLADGTLKMYVLNEEAMTATYKVDGSNLTITSSEGVETKATFKVNGKKLSITDPSSEKTMVYIQQ